MVLVSNISHGAMICFVSILYPVAGHRNKKFLIGTAMIRMILRPRYYSPRKRSLCRHVLTNQEYSKLTIDCLFSECIVYNQFARNSLTWKCGNQVSAIQWESRETYQKKIRIVKKIMTMRKGISWPCKECIWAENIADHQWFNSNAVSWGTQGSALQVRSWKMHPANLSICKFLFTRKQVYGLKSLPLLTTNLRIWQHSAECRFFLTFLHFLTMRFRYRSLIFFVFDRSRLLFSDVWCESFGHECGGPELERNMIYCAQLRYLPTGSQTNIRWAKKQQVFDLYMQSERTRNRLPSSQHYRRV